MGSLGCYLNPKHNMSTKEHFYLGTFQLDPGAKNIFVLRAAFVFPGRPKGPINIWGLNFDTD